MTPFALQSVSKNELLQNIATPYFGNWFFKQRRGSVFFKRTIIGINTQDHKHTDTLFFKQVDRTQLVNNCKWPRFSPSHKYVSAQ